MFGMRLVVVPQVAVRVRVFANMSICAGRYNLLRRPEREYFAIEHE